jgi:hypothetical protein
MEIYNTLEESESWRGLPLLSTLYLSNYLAPCDNEKDRRGFMFKKQMGAYSASMLFTLPM